METMTIYEAGLRAPDGKYAKFISSPNKQVVDEYIEIMKTTKPYGKTILFLEKTFHLVSTTPHIVQA